MAKVHIYVTCISFSPLPFQRSGHTISLQQSSSLGWVELVIIWGSQHRWGGQSALCWFGTRIMQMFFHCDIILGIREQWVSTKTWI